MADDKSEISRRYRELPREEPPRHLDDAILAAARRAVQTRPAPLVVPSGRQRWYFPLAAAAIIVLAVAVTIHMEREQPGDELVSTPSAPAAAAPAAAPSAREMARNETAAQPEKPKPERRRKAESAESRQLRDQAPTAPPPEWQKAPTTAHDAVGNVAQSAAAEARAASPLSGYAVQSPEQWLQGIADLRRQGRHEEADKELAEFRKRYPQYRIAPEMREKVEKR